MSGRAEPESGLLVFLLLGESRERIRQMFEAQPMAKLFALWSAPASAWAEHGLTSPAGGDSGGYIDIIPQELDNDALRHIAPDVPLELLEEYMFIGNPSEVTDRLRKYADAGVEHAV